jgi:hypothetical protein
VWLYRIRINLLENSKTTIFVLIAHNVYVECGWLSVVQRNWRKMHFGTRRPFLGNCPIQSESPVAMSHTAAKARRRVGFSVVAACLAFAGATQAAPFTGSFGFIPGLVNPGGTASFDNSSLTMNSLETVSFGNGTFANESLATVTASTTPITGLSATPTAVNVPAFLSFALASQFSGQGAGNGDQYVFNLQTLSETTPGGFGNFLGTGILVDQNNVLDSTPATMTIGFTGTGNNFAGTLSAAVPEPATMGLLATGLGALSLRRRRSGR